MSNGGVRATIYGGPLDGTELEIHDLRITPAQMDAVTIDRAAEMRSHVSDAFSGTFEATPELLRLLMSGESIA